MPTSADGPDALVDSSVAVALVTMDHEYHPVVAHAIAGRRLGLAGHAAFEALSVLTRLPPPFRRTPAIISRILAQQFPTSRFLGQQSALDLLGRLPGLGISGGAVYDALVAATAVEHGLPLISLDRRAAGTYRALGAELEIF
jgi:predicted nucleic acid-binding protein